MSVNEQGRTASGNTANQQNQRDFPTKPGNRNASGVNVKKANAVACHRINGCENAKIYQVKGAAMLKHHRNPQ
ncbi:MAG: hypothetical protein EOM90_11915 [Alphaproteobacteria bacterium]|nr:hypothetical protein [Alphaproteobacteria bacterium]